MLTNKKRIEIAANLRDLALGYESIPSWSVIACGELLPPIDDVMHAVGLGRAVHASKICSRLADLIEPEPERTCHAVIKERKISLTQTLVTKSCSQCGYAFGDEERRPMLPGLDDEIVINRVRIPNYCQNCGARVVEDAD